MTAPLLPIAWAAAGAAAAVAAITCVRFLPRCRAAWNHDGLFGPHSCVRARWHLGRHRCGEGATATRMDVARSAARKD